MITVIEQALDVQLDLRRMRNWGYAVARAVDVRFQFRDQIRNLGKKLHLTLSIKF